MERLWSGREGAQVALGQGFVPTNPSGAQSKPSPRQGPPIHGEAAGGPGAAPSSRVIPAPSHSLNPLGSVCAVPVLPERALQRFHAGVPREERGQGIEERSLHSNSEIAPPAKETRDGKNE